MVSAPRQTSEKNPWLMRIAMLPRILKKCCRARLSGYELNFGRLRRRGITHIDVDIEYTIECDLYGIVAQGHLRHIESVIS